MNPLTLLRSAPAPAGAQLYIYDTGTQNEAQLYSDRAKIIPIAQPVDIQTSDLIFYMDNNHVDLKIVHEIYTGGFLLIEDQLMWDFDQDLFTTSTPQFSNLKLTARDSASRPVVTGPTVGYNTTTKTFEGYSPDSGQWGSLGGVSDIGGDTYITAEANPGEDFLRFFTAGNEAGYIDNLGNTVLGNLTVQDLNVVGTNNVVDWTTVNVEDNIIVLNSGEVGAGVTLVESGIEIERGELFNAKMVFNESDDTFHFKDVLGTALGINASYINASYINASSISSTGTLTLSANGTGELSLIGRSTIKFGSNDKTIAYFDDTSFRPYQTLRDIDFGTAASRWQKIFTKSSIDTELEADVVGFKIKGHTTQTSNLINIVNSADTELMTLDNSGYLTVPQRVITTTLLVGVIRDNGNSVNIQPFVGSINLTAKTMVKFGAGGTSDIMRFERIGTSNVVSFATYNTWYDISLGLAIRPFAAAYLKDTMDITLAQDSKGLNIKGFTTQTNNLINIVNSADTELMTLDNLGNLVVAGTVNGVDITEHPDYSEELETKRVVVDDSAGTPTFEMVVGASGTLQFNSLI